MLCKTLFFSSDSRKGLFYFFKVRGTSSTAPTTLRHYFQRWRTGFEQRFLNSGRIISSNFTIRSLQICCCKKPDIFTTGVTHFCRNGFLTLWLVPPKLLPHNKIKQDRSTWTVVVGLLFFFNYEVLYALPSPTSKSWEKNNQKKKKKKAEISLKRGLILKIRSAIFPHCEDQVGSITSENMRKMNPPFLIFFKDFKNCKSLLSLISGSEVLMQFFFAEFPQEIRPKNL